MIKPCPWCGNCKASAYVFMPGIRIECLCGASGPIRDTEDEATTAWNRLLARLDAADTLAELVEINVPREKQLAALAAYRAAGSKP